MNASAASRRAIAAPERWSTTVVAGLVAFAAVELGLAIFMALAPHRFYIAIGPFGARNDHYVRDVASYNAALGAGLLIAVRHASWRVPVLAITTIQFALHGLNHLLDISSAHPAWVGYFDFFALAAATVQLAWLTWLALKHPQEQAPSSQHHPEGGTP
ncbi:MAG: hypothetical protein QOI89_2183 [Solirubrobacteraceae bacterium]|jgi:hypothetical protein|nr:hypothetical protein [Solirubrobacteraceae bacterium]